MLWGCPNIFPPATGREFFLRCKLDRRAKLLARQIRWGAADADFRARAEAEQELQAPIRAELEQEWEDLDADWRFYRWPR